MARRPSVLAGSPPAKAANHVQRSLESLQFGCVVSNEECSLGRRRGEPTGAKLHPVDCAEGQRGDGDTGKIIRQALDERVLERLQCGIVLAALGDGVNDYVVSAAGCHVNIQSMVHAVLPGRGIRCSD